MSCIQASIAASVCCGAHMAAYTGAASSLQGLTAMNGCIFGAFSSASKIAAITCFFNSPFRTCVEPNPINATVIYSSSFPLDTVCSCAVMNACVPDVTLNVSRAFMLAGIGQIGVCSMAGCCILATYSFVTLNPILVDRAFRPQADLSDGVFEVPLQSFPVDTYKVENPQTQLVNEEYVDDQQFSSSYVSFDAIHPQKNDGCTIFSINPLHKKKIDHVS